MPYSLQFLDGSIEQDQWDDPAVAVRRRAWLQRNRDEGEPVYCLCNEAKHGPLKLSVVLKETYFLRRYKGTDMQHQVDCAYGTAVCRPIGSRHIPGVAEFEGGGFKLRLGPDIFPGRQVAREEAAEVADQDNAPNAARRPGVVRGSVTLLGVLQLMLEQSATSLWTPAFQGRRTESGVLGRMRKFSEECSFGRGKCLSDEILWAYGRTVDGHAVAQHFHPGADWMDERLVLGFVDAVSPTTNGRSMRCRVTNMGMPLLIEMETWGELRERFPRALITSEKGNMANRVLALMSVRRQAGYRRQDGTTGPDWYFVSNMAPMLMSQQLIPCDSGFEIQCADRLTNLGREFEKPLRYSHGDALHPDFILNDTTPATYCEVWGRDDDEYIRRRAEKVAYCLAEGIPLWEWDAFGGKAMEDFPPAIPGARRP